MSALRRRLVLIGALFAVLVCGSVAASAQTGPSRRSAVVIANEFYGDKVLPTAKADGDLIATTLREAEFDVLLIRNLTAANLSGTSKAIADHIGRSDLAMVYFTGVGVGSGNDIVLQPSDAEDAAANAKPVGLPLGSLLSAVRAGTKSAIFVLDGIPAAAMTDTPLARAVKPLQRQLSADPAPASILLAYSGAVASPTVNDSAGANSIFATVFANAFSQRGVGIQQVFREVRRNVREVTRGAQLPTAEGDVTLDLVLRPEVEDPITSQPRPGLDQIFWTLIKESADIDDFKLFQDAFPSSSLSERSAARRISLSGGDAGDVGRLTLAPGGGAVVAAVEGHEGDLRSLAFGVSGDRAPPVVVRSWPSVLPKTPGGMATMSKSCDDVASDPDDPMRMSPGVQWGLVNIRIAVRTCFVELAREPENRRLLYQVGRLLDMLKLYSWAESFYRDAARLGYSAGYANLAYLHMTGRGRPVDMAAAIPYLKLGADLGNPRCRTDLGFNYLHGLGVETSPQEALLWLRLAGASGWPNALDVLANMYLEGIGVDKDPLAAIELFQASAYVGNTNAMASMGQRYLEGRGVERDPLMAKMWYEKAVAVGNAFAPLYLGQMYRDGDGVPKSAPKAVELMRLSAERGFGEARFRLAEMYEKGSGIPKDLEAAAFNYSLTDHQTFEHPVLPEFVDKAKESLKRVMPKLSAAQVKSLARRVDEYARLNGP